jgi:WD40 repeat protein
LGTLDYLKLQKKVFFLGTLARYFLLLMRAVFLFILLQFFIGTTLFSQTEPRLVLPVGHTAGLISAVFSPDGKLALTASGDKTARIYEVSTGKELQVLRGHTERIVSAVFSPDGKLALTASYDNTARIYEVSTGKALQVLSRHILGLNSAVFSPDGKLVLTASWDHTARIWEVSSGKELQVLSGHTSIVNSAVFSTEGKLALTVSDDRTARLYEVSTGKELQVLRGHTRSVSSAVFSPDGKGVLTASNDSTARIYEVSSGKELQVLSGHTSIVNSAVFSPDGNLVLTASVDHTARLWEVSTGKEVQVLSGHTYNVTSAVFSPDGNLVLTASDDRTARIWEVSSGKELRVLRGHTSIVNSAVFSPDGNLALTASSDNTARLWEVSTRKELQVLRGHTCNVNSAVFSPDGKGVLTASEDNTVRLWEVSTGNVLQVLSEHTDYVRSAVFSPDGKLALTANWDWTARIYEVSTGKELQVLGGHTSWVNSAVFSPDGKLALTASWDDTARIYEVSSGKELQVLSGHTRIVNSAVFSPDGKGVLTASEDNTVRLWEVSTGNVLQVISEHTDYVRSAVFSPDGKLALTASYDNTARLWDVSTGEPLQVLSGHTAGLISAVFSPDGKLALTASRDKTARLWEVSTGNVLQVLSEHTDYVRSAVFSPDGKKVLTTSSDHKTILWDVETGKPLYSRLQLEGNDWLVYDEDYHFDGTPGAIDYLYLTCGLEVIDLSQVKDSLWVPGLVEKIMNKEEIRIHDRPAPKLQDLNICDLTPVIEPLDDGGQGLFRYRIIPRNGGLGDTELYINGNLTYKFKPEQLEKKREQDKDIYYLSISSDTLQGFLTGDKGNENPILVKSKVKGSGIYGRGVVLDIEKETDKENPKFFGLFIGVNDYGNPNKEQSEFRYRNLDFAAKDANDLSKAVEATARNLFQQDCYIYNLTGTGNAENIPTKANMQKALKEIGEKAKASDILYIFFAGHGDIPEKSGEKEIRFMLHNADKKNLLSSSFGVEELSQWCDPKQIKAQKRVFVFDACHSGQIINQTLAFNGRGDEEATRIRQLDKLKDKNGMMILAAAADNESAYEDETLNQGVLTYHLLDAMKKEKDTSLIIRQWFDEAIEGVKEYSRANGNKQEPNSFGDGRFEIGNVNEQVRAGIDITCPKTRVGLCEFLAIGEVAERYPSLKNDLSNVFKQVIPRGEFVLSKNLEKAYRVSGVVSMNKGKVSVQYEVKKGEQSIASIQLPIFKKNSTAQEILDEVTLSIEKEIETLDNRKEQCVKNN